MNREEINIKIMAYIDGELPESEKAEISELISSDEDFKSAYDSLIRVKEVAGEMKFRKLPDMYWDDYWDHLYNRIERGISWILISMGAIIVLLFLLWRIIENLLADQDIHILLKTGIFLLMSGTMVLIISVLREKLMVRKVDKYRKVER